MDTIDYLMGWAIYLIAATGLSWIAWRVYKKYLWRELAYFFQCIMLALFYTPWYVLSDQDILAPAIMIIAMDTVTIGGAAGIRALIPMVMALMLAFIVAAVLSINYRIRKHKKS